MTKIVADAHIPFLRGVLDPFAEVTYLPGRNISRDDVRDADILLTRTRTRCTASLLQGSRVRFIGSATIGVDHIDAEFCREHGIKWFNAPGCNAGSVMQYVASALAYLSAKHDLALGSLTLGIVGVGSVGSRVERLARILGMEVLRNDPPRERREGQGGFVSLESVLREADIITLHVPLNRQGPDRTARLFDRDQFRRMKRKPFLINTARGEVVDSQALKEAIREEKVRGAVLDVWESEPRIDLELLRMADLGTPHIAGYSVDGKANGTSMVVRALSGYQQWGMDEWYPPDLPAPANPVLVCPEPAGAEQEILLSCIRSTYRVESDCRRLCQSPSAFEQQRESYPARREFSSYRVIVPPERERLRGLLRELGFG